MTEAQINELEQQTHPMDAPTLLRFLMDRFGNTMALASSLQAEDQVLTDMLCHLTKAPSIFTLDTGRLHQETYDTIEQTNRHYNIHIEVLFPDAVAVESLVNQHGPNAFYRSVELRKQCCHARKVLPLQGKLKTLSAWITGQRRQQALTRSDLPRIQWDSQHGLIKINPLADWTSQQVKDYIEIHSVPINPLHAQGYPSIGCAPCTRAIQPGQDDRAGRWWWEQPEQKECGLHLINGQLRPNRETHS